MEWLLIPPDANPIEIVLSIYTLKQLIFEIKKM